MADLGEFFQYLAWTGKGWHVDGRGNFVYKTRESIYSTFSYRDVVVIGLATQI
jgi:hypothetical protein